MKKIAIVRGPALSKWEMQIYEPLTRWFDITAIGSTRPLNDIADIQFPIKKLLCPSQLISKLPFVVPSMFQYFGDTQYLLDFEKTVKDYDLIHAVELRSAFSLQAVRAKKNGLVKAVTVTIYENIPFLYDDFSARKRLKQEVMDGADKFLAANQAAKHALLAEGVADSRISIIPQSIDTKKFRPRNMIDERRLNMLKKRFGLLSNDYVVLSTGRIVWEKGWWDMVRAVYHILKIKYQISKRNNIKFLLVGDGSEKEKLTKFVHQNKLNQQVIFTGGLPYQDMPDIYRLADIFVHASLPTPIWNEQFGGNLIEAMATGLPIIATLAGGSKETVGERGGIYIQPQDFASLSSVILRLFKDKHLRTKMGRDNRKIAVAKYDTLVVAKKIKNIWDKLLN